MNLSPDSLLGLRSRLSGAVLAAALAACGADPGGETSGASVNSPEALNMQLVGMHALQGRSAYQPVVHNYAGRHILFVGHHAGEAVDPATGVTERNGMSILDVTDPAAPELLVHVPPSGLDANGTQHVQVCAGADLPNGDPAVTYLVRTNGQLSYELWDVTDPAAPAFLATIAETGESSRRESSRGTRETHKLQWECASGIGYFNGTPEGWRVTRALQVFDLGNPAEPRHIRDFGLVGWEPTAQGPMPPNSVSGLHQAFAHGDRLYLGYGSGNDGTLQIIDVESLLQGDPNSDDPMLPTRDNLLYPQIARLDMPRYWGVHTAKPMLDVELPGHVDDGAVRDFPDRRVGVGPGVGALPRCLRRRLPPRHHGGGQALARLVLGSAARARRLLRARRTVRAAFHGGRVPPELRRQAHGGLVLQCRSSGRRHQEPVRARRGRLVRARDHGQHHRILRDRRR